MVQGKAVVPVAPQEQQPSGAQSLMTIIDRAAKDPTFDVAKLDHLLQVKERWDKAEAERAFVAALNAFKADPPVLTKNKVVKFESQKGTTEYSHATLDQVSAVIGRGLAAHGLSHRWDVKQDAAGITVACVLTHVQGHSERVAMTAPADNSGSKNSIQAIGSTVTYLQRYTLLSATGLAVKGQDDDGARAEGMDEKVRLDFEAAIDAAADAAGLEKVWKEAVEACRKTPRDMESYSRLKKLVSDKGKALKAAARGAK